jgi:signal transduction protein with GAF and PtsI domain
MLTTGHAFLQERERAVGRGREQLGALVEAGKVLAAERSLDAVLQRIVEVACRLLQARYGALGTLDAAGALDRFVTTGLDEEQRARMGSLPTGRRILGVAVRERPLPCDLTVDPRPRVPPDHPAMRSFLGVPIVSRGAGVQSPVSHGKTRRKSSAKRTSSLPSRWRAGGVAIENASLYESAALRVAAVQDLLVRQKSLRWADWLPAWPTS